MAARCALSCSARISASPTRGATVHEPRSRRNPGGRGVAEGAGEVPVGGDGSTVCLHLSIGPVRVKKLAGRDVVCCLGRTSFLSKIQNSRLAVDLTGRRVVILRMYIVAVELCPNGPYLQVVLRLVYKVSKNLGLRSLSDEFVIQTKKTIEIRFRRSDSASNAPRTVCSRAPCHFHRETL